MPDLKGDKLFVNLGASQTRRRLKGFGHGVRKVQSAGRSRSIIIHTATGQHLKELESKFADVGFSRKEIAVEVVSTVFFPVSKIDTLRNRAEKASRVPDHIPDGWSKSSVDPMNLLKVFKALKIKAGFILHAYQYGAGDNGNGFIWAMPIDATFPDPLDCPRLTDRFLEPPKPLQALDDFMDAIDGDGTPWSYMSASVFEREASEFGAMWHGCDWSTHNLLGADPWQPGPEPKRRSREMDRPSENPDEWTWHESRPSEWQPSFEQQHDQITIRFLTFSGLGQQAIYSHKDIFKVGQYRSETEITAIADGPWGFVF